MIFDGCIMWFIRMWGRKKKRYTYIWKELLCPISSIQPTTRHYVGVYAFTSFRNLLSLQH